MNVKTPYIIASKPIHYSWIRDNGKGKIPALMGDLAKGINAFKSGLKEEKKEISEAAKVINEDKDSETVMSEEKEEVLHGRFIYSFIILSIS